MSPMIQISALTVLLSLTGCSIMEPVSMNEQSGLQVMPYKQTLSLQGDKQHLAQSKHDLTSFIGGLESKTLSQVVTLHLYSGEGVLLKAHARQLLLAVGVPSARILSQDLSMNHDPSRTADFSITVTQYKTVLPQCEPTHIDNFYRAGNGCFVNSARTSSLVDSQAMFPTHSMNN